MAIVSLGAPGTVITYDFDSPFTIVSQGPGYWGGTNTSLTPLAGDVLQGEEGHGTIRFIGTFASFSWTVPKPEGWHGFTFGIRTTERLEPTPDAGVDGGTTADAGRRRRGRGADRGCADDRHQRERRWWRQRRGLERLRLLLRPRGDAVGAVPAARRRGAGLAGAPPPLGEPWARICSSGSCSPPRWSAGGGALVGGCEDDGGAPSTSDAAAGGAGGLGGAGGAGARDGGAPDASADAPRDVAAGPG